MADFKLRKRRVTGVLQSRTPWDVYHPEVETLRFGHIEHWSTGWRAFDHKGRPFDDHRLMTRTEAASAVAANYANRRK